MSTKKWFNYHTAGVADSCQPGRDVLPHTNAALADRLPSCQLQEEQGNAHNHHQQHIKEKKSTCGEEVTKQVLLNLLLVLLLRILLLLLKENK